ncbi:hypothetical protein AAMO2058_001232000 [Amorphochlora amoebiformis]
MNGSSVEFESRRVEGQKIRFELKTLEKNGVKCNTLVSWVDSKLEGDVARLHLYTTTNPWKLVRLISHGNSSAPDKGSALRLSPTRSDDRKKLVELSKLCNEAGIRGLEGIGEFIAKFPTYKRQGSIRFAYSRRDGIKLRRSPTLDRLRSSKLFDEILTPETKPDGEPKNIRSIMLPPPVYLAPPAPPLEQMEDETLKSFSSSSTFGLSEGKKADLWDKEGVEASSKLMNLNARQIKQEIRNGLKTLTRKHVWLYLVCGTKPEDIDRERLEDELDSEEEVLWHGHVPESEAEMHAHVPDFGGMSLLHSHPLTANGEIIVKRLLCLIQTLHPHITYCPMLPDLTALLCIHMDDWRAFHLLCTLLKRTNDKDEFYLPLSGERFMCHVESLQTLLEARCRTLAKHIESLGIDAVEIFEVWIARLFVGYLKYRTVLRILDAFLLEGSKILFRIGLAVMIMHRDNLLLTRTAREFKRLLAKLMITSTPSKVLFQTAFGLSSFSKKMLRNLHATHKITNIPFAKVPVFYTPAFDEKKSDLLTVPRIRFLWKHLDPVHGIQDPVLLFAGKTHGYSLPTLRKLVLDSCGYRRECVAILVVKSEKEVIFGSVLHLLEDSRGRLGSGGGNRRSFRFGQNTFLFTLHPRQAAYELKGIDAPSLSQAATDDITMPGHPPSLGSHTRSNSQPPRGSFRLKKSRSTREARTQTKQENHIGLHSKTWLKFSEKRLAFGGPDQTAMNLDEKLHNGSSEPCGLFESPSLSSPTSSEDFKNNLFKATVVELWGLTH